MLMPKRQKYRKMQRGNMRGKAQRGASIAFGEIALKCLEPGEITARQIEAARVAINRKVKRGGKLWIRIFPDRPFTKKPAEVRMGKGKGNPEGYVARIKPGKILFELAGVEEELAKQALQNAAFKLPLKTKIVTLNDQMARG
ncbi:MAG: 50S ribosomal protein L16 [Chrysiogenales bacterium]|nr:MAG: 50S ribosomal protein L16 [Chrysiogenales bacterium]